MAKFHGKVGFVEVVETRPSVFEEIPTEREYSGDVKKNYNRSVETMTSINDNIVFSTNIEIIADPYINSHFPSIKYVKWKGACWKVTSTDDSSYPRIILSLGDIYNGKQVKD